MTINTTRWTPDTCANPPCVFEYTWDNTVPENQRVHTLSNVLQKCSRHSSQNDSTSYSNVLEENSRKNVSYQLVLDNGPTALSDLVNGSRQIKNGISFSWSWSGTPPNTVLNISYAGITLTNQQKTSIQTFLDNRFGSGKVVIV